MNWLIATGAVVLASVVIAGLIAYQGFGRRTILVWGARIEWVRCETCDGCGVLGYYEGKWAIIPREHRLFVSEGTHFEAPLANTMKCPDCQRGGNWLPKEEKK